MMQCEHPRWCRRAERAIAQTTCTNSKRPSAFIEGIYPTHVAKGHGCYLYDVKGNRYIDFVGGLGTNILGYGHPKVTEAVVKYAYRGPSLSLPHTLEVEVAEKVKDMFPFIEKVRFFKTGSEACSAAVRIARAYNSSGNYVISDGYHGWHDLFTSMSSPALGVRDSFCAVDTFSYNPTTYYAACWITEPLHLDASPDRIKEVRRWMGLAEKNNFVTIFDEIVTGLRVPNHSVASWWKLKPDLICLGKGIANGYPLSIVGGRSEVMDCGEWFCSSTYAGDVVSLAACQATLNEVSKNKSVEDLFFYADNFLSSLNSILDLIDVEIEGYGTRGLLDVSTRNAALLMQECCKANILLGKAYFFSWAHLEAEITEHVLNVIGDVVERIKRGRTRLEGPMPIQTFKR